MNKRGKWIIWASIIVLVLFVIALFFYYALAKPRNNFNSGEVLVNPAINLSLEEIEQQFDEKFVYYLLYYAEAYNLHNPPLSRDTPKIELKIGEDVYSAVVDDGNMLVAKTGIDERDIILITAKSEAAKMIKYPEYIKDSFSSGKSSVELVANKATLFSKGYLNLYTKLTGKSITGNVVRMYTD